MDNKSENDAIEKQSLIEELKQKLKDKMNSSDPDLIRVIRNLMNQDDEEGK